MPSGILPTKSLLWAISSAVRISSSDACCFPLSPRRMFSRISPANSTAFWETYPSLSRSFFRSYSRTSTPSTLTLPLLTSYSLGSRLTSVVLPEPVAPINAIVSPLWAVKVISPNISASAPGYRKDTWSNSISPSRLFSLSRLPFFRVGAVCSTSRIRFAETCARGSMTKIIASIINDMMTCIE